MLEKGAIEVAPRAFFTCRLFFVDKKNGGRRPVLNLKPLNKYTAPKHFKMVLESSAYLLAHPTLAQF